MGDLSRVKEVMTGIMSDVVRDGRISLGEFLFAKEVRMGGYSGPLPPQAQIIKNRTRLDPRANALYAERIPFVVVASTTNQRLFNKVQEPWELTQDCNQFRIDSKYYIEKALLPPMERLLKLLGADPNR